MKNKIGLVGQFKTDWIRYSDYEFKEDEQGEVYIIPQEEAYFTMYNPFDVADELIFDLMFLGDEVLRKEQNKELIKSKVLIFAKKYGLLGLISSSVYNRNIIGEDKVLLIDHNFISKEKILDVKEYLKLFLPFASEDDVSIREYKRDITVVKAEDSPKFYGKRPLVLDVVFSRFYAEKLDSILAFAENIVKHFNEVLIYRNNYLTESVNIMAGKFKAEKIGLTINMLDKAMLVWEFDSLKTAVETLYAFAVTDENSILNRCEYCKKVYIAKSEREKYCSPSCRNCSNVIKSRNKKKACE
jgi:hypothetical protein